MKHNSTEISQKINDLSENWQNFYLHNKEEAQQVEDKIRNLQQQYAQLSVSLQRPTNSAVDNHSVQKQYLFDYIRKGNYHPNLLKKADSLVSGDVMQSSTIIESSISKKILNALTSLSPMRQLASVEEISTGALDVILQSGNFDCDWVSEDAARNITSVAELKKSRIVLHQLYGQPKASQTLLDDACIDIEKWLTEQLSYSFSLKENKSFIEGDGVKQPKGIFASNGDKITIHQEEALSAEILMSFVNKLENHYVSNAAFLMNRKTLSAIQILKDANDRFIWHGAFSALAPDTLLGKSVFCCDSVPDKKIVFGDFRSGYKIVDHSEMSIMRDPYSYKPFVSFYAVKRVGGMLVNNKALIALELTK